MPPALHLLDGRPWSGVDWVDPLALLGCYTSFVVEADGTVARLGEHLVRLEADTAVLFGRSVARDDLLRPVRAHARRVGAPCRLRVSVVARTPPLQPQDVLSLHVATSSRPVPPASEGPWRVRTEQHVRPLAEVKVHDPWVQLLKQRARWAGYDDALLARGDDLLEGTTWGLVGIGPAAVVVPRDDVLTSTGARRVVEALRLVDTALPVEHRPLRRDELAGLRVLVATNAVVPVTVVAAVDGADVPVDLDLVAGLRRSVDVAPRERLLG